ncbi:hypothetical protein [Mucilaginibacter sp.]|uniref:hypothetical protein n=1 Tax=Mucilaginibacter sp. TaxID=1882438 RepID=UPI0026055394|nr:hypothetical protein [Mucilaginibacter sp.]MDB4920768.1 hypothetical protein [Mucilaginibacter sp.]
MKEDVIATESFSHYGKTYFFDYLRAANGTDYIRIARSDRQPDDHFEKQCVVIFEENFPLLLEAMSSLFRTAGTKERQVLNPNVQLTGNARRVSKAGTRNAAHVKSYCYRAGMPWPMRN